MTHQLRVANIPVSSNTLRKLSGAEQAPFRMHPAQQGLEGDDAALGVTIGW